jgi:general secretion pathway protein L
MSSITDALDIQLARLRTRYARTPLPRFFAWWMRELVALLPARWRALLAERSDALLLENQAPELVLWRQSSDHSVELGRISLAEPADAQKDAYARLRGQIDDPNLPQFYCIRSERTLRRSLSLPTAAEDNLRQVLSFEMDRQTPFKADQVYFDYDVAPRTAAERNLQIELTVVPRSQLDGELLALAGCGAQLDGVDCWNAGSGSTRSGLNLLPPDRRVKRKNLQLRLNLALAGAAAVLLITVMLQSLDNRESALAAMTQEVEKAQNDAKQVTQLRKTLEDTINSANFLSRKKRETPLMVGLLNDLATRLPDDTYLERLNIDEKNKIELQGLSTDASKLIALLQKSELLINPSVQGTIQPDPRTKKDRFNIVVEFRGLAETEKAHEAKPADHGSHKDGGSKNAPAAGSP